MLNTEKRITIQILLNPNWCIEVQYFTNWDAPLLQTSDSLITAQTKISLMWNKQNSSNLTDKQVSVNVGNPNQDPNTVNKHEQHVQQLALKEQHLDERVTSQFSLMCVCVCVWTETYRRYLQLELKKVFRSDQSSSQY